MFLPVMVAPHSLQSSLFFLFLKCGYESCFLFLPSEYNQGNKQKNLYCYLGADQIFV